MPSLSVQTGSKANAERYQHRVDDVDDDCGMGADPARSPCPYVNSAGSLLRLDRRFSFLLYNGLGLIRVSEA